MHSLQSRWKMLCRSDTITADHRGSGFSSWVPLLMIAAMRHGTDSKAPAKTTDALILKDGGLKDDEVIFDIIQPEKHIVPDFFLCHSLCFAGSGQPRILVGSKWLAARTEDSSRRDDLEQTFRKLREHLRYSDLVPGDEWPTESSEARGSQRETHGTQTPFAQHPHRGRSGRWCGSRNRRSGAQAVLIAKLLFGYWWNSPTGRNRRGARWRGGRRRRVSFAFSQHDLPGEFALVCFNFAAQHGDGTFRQLHPGALACHDPGSDWRIVRFGVGFRAG